MYVNVQLTISVLCPFLFKSEIYMNAITMAWFSSITKFSWSDVIWTTNRTQNRLVTSVWHGGAADSAKQNQTCNVRFSTPPLLGCPVMMSLLYCRFYMILKISSTWHRFLLCPCVNFQRRSHFWQTLSRGVLIILVNQTSPWEIFRVRICDSSQDCRYLWWTFFFPCLMLKDILVESHHFLMELRVV